MGDDVKTEEDSGGIQFMPPLYTQRYVLAVTILVEHNIKSVVDFGCSECGFLKILPTASCVEKAALVDVDRDLLVAKKRQIYPEVHHFLQRRENPFHVSLFSGSAEDMDARIQGCEAATLIEVIEHLYQDTLTRVTENVFGRLRPRLAVVTTPNSEFNVLFKNADPTQFRHWDHKFEWTRLEFQTWCTNVCSRFGYEVKYTGVGQINSDPESIKLGPCSQAAVFTIRTTAATTTTVAATVATTTAVAATTTAATTTAVATTTTAAITAAVATTTVATTAATTASSSSKVDVPPVPKESGDADSYCVFGELYELIAEAEFPYVKEKLSPEELLDQEVAYCLRGIVHSRRSEVPFGEEHRVSVAHVAQYRSIQTLADSNTVRKSLERQLFTLTPNQDHILIVEEDSSSGEDDDEEEEQEEGQEEEADADPLLCPRGEWEGDLRQDTDLEKDKHNLVPLDSCRCVGADIGRRSINPEGLSDDHGSNFHKEDVNIVSNLEPEENWEDEIS